LTDEAGEPVGYWLKHLDGLLEQAFDHVLARHGVRRRHWQVLTTLRGGPVTRAGIAEALLPFWIAASVTQTDVVDDLVRRGWASFDADAYALTPEGEAAHVAVEAEVAGLRRVLVEGLTAEEYHAVVDALARMAANLERALPEARGGVTSPSA
jgi:DNA-binding MarR family transcriptional regulator